MTLLDEWIEKAEADLRGAAMMNRKQKDPVPDLVCYHSQQCIEKYLKAYLVSNGAVPPRTHNLEDLLALCIAYDPMLRRHVAAVQVLNPYGIAIRYPGATATSTNAAEALKTARSLRRALRRKLGL